MNLYPLRILGWMVPLVACVAVVTNYVPASDPWGAFLIGVGGSIVYMTGQAVGPALEPMKPCPDRRRL